MASFPRTVGILFVGLAVAWISVSAAQGQSSSSDVAVALVDRLVEENAAGNVIVSPYSLTAVLAMLEAGAAGETRKKLRAALGMKGPKEAALFRKHQHALLDDLRLSEPQILLQTASGIWNSPQLAVKSSYFATLRADFGADAATVDFLQPAAVASINDWVHQKTDGAIPVLVAQLPEDTLLVLANTVHFKGNWLVAFDPTETKEGLFRRADGTTRPVSLMSRKGEYAYQNGNAGQVVRLAYADSRFTMTLWLPPEENAPRLTPGIIKTLLDPEAYKLSEGTVVFPHLSFNTLLPLADTLSRIGLGELFGNEADYPGISAAPFRLTQVIQRVAVSVDENGTEAAAATAGLAERGIAGPKPFTMVCDRPFYFVIDDRKTGAVLFIGHIGDVAP